MNPARLVLLVGCLGSALAAAPSFASELIISDGVTLVLDDPLDVPDGSILTVDGTLQTPSLNVEGLFQGSGTVTGDVFILGGTLSPGGSVSIGSLTIGGEPALSPTEQAAFDAAQQPGLPVPEPSTWLLLAIALLTVVRWRP